MSGDEAGGLFAQSMSQEPTAHAQRVARVECCSSCESCCSTCCSHCCSSPEAPSAPCDRPAFNRCNKWFLSISASGVTRPQHEAITLFGRLEARTRHTHTHTQTHATITLFGRLEAGFEVSLDVFDILEAHRDADHVLRHPGLAALLLRQLLVGGRRRVDR